MTQIFRPIRLLQYAALVCLETTLIHLVGTLLTSSMGAAILRWWVLLAIVAAGALSTSLFERVDAPRPRIRSLTAVLALAAVILGTWAQVRAMGTSGGLSVLLDLDKTESLLAYVVVLASTWAWWRGAKLVDLGHSDVVRDLRGGVITLAVVMVLLALGGDEPDLMPAAQGTGLSIAAEIIGYLALGLTSLSLARIVAAAGEGAPGAAWRWLRSGVVSTLTIVVVGVLLLAVVADPAREILRTAILWTLYGLLAALAPVFWLIFKVFDIIRRALAANGYLEPLPPVTATPPPPDQALQRSPLGSLAPLLSASTALLLLVPLVALALLILFATRRRQSAQGPDDEERESIFSWSAARSDLRDLFRGLRRSTVGEGGLRGALARLTGPDPAMRIRRRYVQLLLTAEDAGRARPPAQTPHEYAGSLAKLPLDAAPVGTLTELYEEARYAPDAVDAEAAARADAAWEAIESARLQPSPPRRADRQT